ncbi:MAG: DMT family transporter [Planctomycetes bacterium]|nr:DMT family transporter [Planctomycetota bacterium]MCB9870666.1 DMT family transporter [Planctomycetota bacterium]MCB9888673.1 DMT family transporter [Planctomycetota bacterium]MCB9889974.1 DMT family transporter [Planctomycetota bacterium]
MTRLPGLVLMAMSALSFSLMAVFIRVAARSGIPTAEIAFVRGVLCAVLTVAAIHAAAGPWRIGRPWLLLLRGATGTTGLFLYVHALGRAPLSDAMALQYTHPFFAALFAGWFLGERLPRHCIPAMLLCAAGAAFILRPTGEGDLYGNVIALLSGVSSGVAYTAIRAAARTESPLLIILVLHLTTAVAGLVAMLGNFVWPSTEQWGLLVGVALASQAGQWCLTHGLRKERAGVATTVGYSAVALGALWSFLFFGEPVGTSALVGIATMTAGMALLSHGASTRTRAQAHRT